MLVSDLQQSNSVVRKGVPVIVCQKISPAVRIGIGVIDRAVRRPERSCGTIVFNNPNPIHLLTSHESAPVHN